MITRREFTGRTTLYGATQAITLTSAGCAKAETYDAFARALRWPVEESANLRELVRCATLAANSHNTQAWKFALSPRKISIRPDFLRRTPAVDPDNHHLWVSLGCACENLVVAAAAAGRHAEATFGETDIAVALEDTAAVARPELLSAIFQRQCTRSQYDGKPLPNTELEEMVRAAERPGVRLLVLTESPRWKGCWNSWRPATRRKSPMRPS